VCGRRRHYSSSTVEAMGSRLVLYMLAVETQAAMRSSTHRARPYRGQRVGKLAAGIEPGTVDHA
jgi:hypothetical protein